MFKRDFKPRIDRLFFAHVVDTLNPVFNDGRRSFHINTNNATVRISGISADTLYEVTVRRIK